MVAVYPTDAVFNVNNFSTVASVQYNNTNTTTEFVLPSGVTSVAQVLPFSDGVLQDPTTYTLSTFQGTTYSNIAFNGPLYATVLVLRTVNIPPSFFIWKDAISTSLVSYSNTVPVTIRGNTYVVNGSRTVYALPLTSNTSNKDAILVARSGVTQSQPEFTFPSSTLNIYGIDLLDAPLANETLEIRVFDSGAKKYTRKTSIGDRKADKGFSYTREPDVKTTKFIGGYEKRRLNSRRMRRKWNFQYTNITGIEKESIENFYLARSGTYESFSFDLTHLNELGLATVVFDSPPTITNVLSASTDDLSQNFYNVTMVFRETDD